MAFKKDADDAPSFSLTNANSTFSNKSKDIFAGLVALEQKHDAFQKVHSSRDDALQRDGIMKHDPIEDDDTKRLNRHDYNSRTDRNHVHDDRDARHRDTELSNSKRRYPRDDFRKPRNFAPKAKKVPDHKNNPESWTCYSLEDVSETDMSERSTKRAALDFIYERKNEREKQERIAAGLPAEEEKFESNTAACSKGLITFSRTKGKHHNAKKDIDDGLVERKMSGKSKLDSDHDADKVPGYFEENDEEDEIQSSSDDGDKMARKARKLDDNGDKSLSLNVDVDLDLDDKDKTSTESVVPSFKSRKRNVKKQIRQKISFNVDEDNDDDNN